MPRSLRGRVKKLKFLVLQVKKLIKRLTEARGNGTSMISLIIPPKDQISRAAKMLAEEYVRYTMGCLRV